jgi:hypothetical protein
MLTDTCTIEADTGGRGVYGEPAHQWATVAANVPCRRLPARRGPAEDERGHQHTLVDRYRLIVPHSTALDVGQRVTVGGESYRIVALVDQHTAAVDAQAVMERAR